MSKTPFSLGHFERNRVNILFFALQTDKDWVDPTERIVTSIQAGLPPLQGYLSPSDVP